jgi:hypothetical protein
MEGSPKAKRVPDVLEHPLSMFPIGFRCQKTEDKLIECARDDRIVTSDLVVGGSRTFCQKAWSAFATLGFSLIADVMGARALLRMLGCNLG